MAHFSGGPIQQILGTKNTAHLGDDAASTKANGLSVGRTLVSLETCIITIETLATSQLLTRLGNVDIAPTISTKVVHITNTAIS